MKGKATKTTSPRRTSIIVVDIESRIAPDLVQRLFLQTHSLGAQPRAGELVDFAVDQLFDHLSHGPISPRGQDLEPPVGTLGDVNHFSSSHESGTLSTARHKKVPDLSSSLKRSTSAFAPSIPVFFHELVSPLSGEFGHPFMTSSTKCSIYSQCCK